VRSIPGAGFKGLKSGSVSGRGKRSGDLDGRNDAGYWARLS
jgi:hypothetical protein